MHSLQKMWPFWQHIGSITGFKQRQQASNGLIESLPSLSFWVPYPSFRFSSYVKKARSLLFFECLWGISQDRTITSINKTEGNKLNEMTLGRVWTDRAWWPYVTSLQFKKCVSRTVHKDICNETQTCVETNVLETYLCAAIARASVCTYVLKKLFSFIINKT